MNLKSAQCRQTPNKMGTKDNFHKKQNPEGQRMQMRCEPPNVEPVFPIETYLFSTAMEEIYIGVPETNQEL